MSEEELTKAIEGLGMDEGDGEGNILPIMQSIMQNLLSKDVLYPSLKEITEKVCELLVLFFFFFFFHFINSCGLLCLLRTHRDGETQYISPFVFFSLMFIYADWGELERSFVSKRIKHYHTEDS